MQIEIWPISRPIPYERNARNVTPENVESLASLIREYGFRVPIIVDENDIIVAGHTRIMAAKKLGLADIPVHVATGLSESQVRGLRLSDNRVQQNTTWNYELLSLELTELKDEFGFDLALTAFEDSEMRPLLAQDFSPIAAPTDENRGVSQAERPAKQEKYTHEFTADQFEIVNRAIDRIRDIENDRNISPGRAIELFSADYLSSVGDDPIEDSDNLEN